MLKNNIKHPQFGIWDYWRMYQARGIQLPFKYFVETHLFDLLNNTDTHTWLPKSQHETIPENFEHGTFYMSSWSSEIQNSFHVIDKLLGDEFSEYSFIDIGCGKGKVVLTWRKACAQARKSQAIFGIDYYEPFLDIARNNNQRVFHDDGNYSYEDATKTRFQAYGDKLIIYLANPFDEFILEKVITNLSSSKSIIIYNYPVHGEIIVKHGYKLIYEKMGSLPLAQTRIYSNHITTT